MLSWDRTDERDGVFRSRRLGGAEPECDEETTRSPGSGAAAPEWRLLDPEPADGLSVPRLAMRRHSSYSPRTRVGPRAVRAHRPLPRVPRPARGGAKLAGRRPCRDHRAHLTRMGGTVSTVRGRHPGRRGTRRPGHGWCAQRYPFRGKPGPHPGAADRGRRRRRLPRRGAAARVRRDVRPAPGPQPRRGQGRRCRMPPACCSTSGLPDTHELDGLRWLQENVPAVAVVVLTGLADEYLGEEAVRLGAQDYLVKGQVDGPLLDRVIRYAVERERSDELQRQLRDAQIYAEENGRLERGLLPTPIVSDAGADGHRPLLARRAAAPARRRLLRRGPDRGRVGARGGRRRLRPRARTRPRSVCPCASRGAR